MSLLTHTKAKGLLLPRVNDSDIEAISLQPLTAVVYYDGRDLRLFGRDDRGVLPAQNRLLSSDQTLTTDASVTFDNVATSQFGDLNATLTSLTAATTDGPRYFVRAVNSEIQSIDENALTQVLFPFELDDADGLFASNSYTAPVAGLYYVSVRVFSGIAEGTTSYQLRVTGSVQGTIHQQTMDYTIPTVINVPLWVDLSLNESVSVYFYHDGSGGSVSISSSSPTIGPANEFVAYLVK